MARQDARKILIIARTVSRAAEGLNAVNATERVLRTGKERGASLAPETVELYSFEHFCRQIGSEDVWEFERRWGGAAADKH